ncbi:unnamed protein product [Nezara viridula]|uniref:Uncharacterized protein n=1 Tax=Nezara viridula TaxID=85310 RepID=A0A9P0HRL3_NEZVI|nr:unnamed protein product [Nezara viridula]
MMTRASQPVTLTAGKMYPINVEILVGLFQFTYTISMALAKCKI